MADNNTTDRPIAKQPAPRSSHTLRLTFAYDGDKLRLMRSQRVAMITPPSVTPPPEVDQSGSWFEVRDANDNLLNHRVIHDPIPNDVEFYSSDPTQTITRVPKSKLHGEFTLLVPDLAEASTFILRGTPLAIKARNINERRAEVQFMPAEELFRCSFDELRSPEVQQGGGEVSP